LPIGRVRTVPVGVTRGVLKELELDQGVSLEGFAELVVDGDGDRMLIVDVVRRRLRLRIDPSLALSGGPSLPRLLNTVGRVIAFRVVSSVGRGFLVDFLVRTLCGRFRADPEADAGRADLSFTLTHRDRTLADRRIACVFAVSCRARVIGLVVTVGVIGIVRIVDGILVLPADDDILIPRRDGIVVSDRISVLIADRAGVDLVAQRPTLRRVRLALPIRTGGIVAIEGGRRAGE
jgi:hypothetical protein